MSKKDKNVIYDRILRKNKKNPKNFFLACVFSLFTTLAIEKRILFNFWQVTATNVSGRNLTVSRSLQVMFWKLSRICRLKAYNKRFIFLWTFLRINKISGRYSKKEKRLLFSKSWGDEYLSALDEAIWAECFDHHKPLNGRVPAEMVINKKLKNDDKLLKQHVYIMNQRENLF